MTCTIFSPNCRFACILFKMKYPVYIYMHWHWKNLKKYLFVSLETSHVTLTRMEFALSPRPGLEAVAADSLLLLSASKKKTSA